MYKLILTSIFILLVHISYSQCTSQSVDTDQDGICNLLDICPNLDDNLIGTPCDDSDACTTNDVWTSSCDCVGALLPDSDKDGICDAQDQCPNFDDNLDMDDDGIPYCMDDCIDVNENDICDDIDDELFTNKVKVYFSHQRGFYENTFQLNLVSNHPNAIIKYSVNGDNPIVDGQIYTSPITINSTTPIRTVAYTTTDTSKTKSNTFIFLDDVLQQSDAVAEFPVPIEFSSTITNNATWSPQMEEALKSIPTVCLALDLDDFNEIFNTKGIDKFNNFEYFDAEGNSYGEPSSVNTYGNSSFSKTIKKNYRLKFKEETGESRFKYPIFGNDATDEFDVIDLRCGSQGAIIRDGVQNIHENFFKDLQIEMSEYGPHTFFAHLYINGIYWGVYSGSERPNKSFGESYFGGDKDDYNTIKGTCCNTTPLAIDGNITSYNDLPAQATNYNTINQYLDIDHFMDYILLCNYGPHGDWRVWNTYVIDNPKEEIPLRFFMWDPEPSLKNDWYYTDILSGTRDHNSIWNPLKAHEEFRVDYGDNVQCECMEETGAMYPPNLEKKYEALFDKNKLAYLMEVARWKELPLYNEFLAYRDDLVSTNWFEERKNIILNEYVDQDLYPSTSAVIFSTNESLVENNTVINLSHTNSGGTIYYTTDGSDPRLVGGDINPNAIQNSTLTLTAANTTVRARVLHNGIWSAMCPKTFYTSQNYKDIVINEIHYNPKDSIILSDTISGKNFEFIELKNTGSSSINLYGVAFSKGIELKINTQMLIPAGGFVVFAEDADWFEARYGFAPDGVYQGQLDNGGEKINLKDPQGYFIDTVRYDANNPWDEAPDDSDLTLELLHSDLDNSNPFNWFRSDNIDGTPKAENSRTCAQANTSIVINEINYNSNDDVFDPDSWVELYNPNSSSVDLSGWEFYDNGNQFILPQGTQIASQGYLVLVKNQSDFTTAFPNVNSNIIVGDFTFGLSKKGERISLFDNNKCLVDYVIYNDKAPWPIAPDGDGPTLALLDPILDNALASSWESSNSSSISFYGSPGRINFCAGFSNTSICSQINSSADDAEENISDGSVTITSGDLDIGNDEGVIFKVGLRFQNIDIPQGAKITSATIEFTADEVNTEATTLVFKGENIDNAPVFIESNNNITNRTTTSNNVTWQPNAWNTVGANQTTADLSPIIQEIINRQGFTAGNAIALIVEGSGIRTAEAFDGSPLLAPKLCVTYSSEQCGVNAKVLLEGLYDVTNNNMHTQLADNNLLPLAQPFNATPWNYNGAESVTSFPSGVVDWILIATRDSNGDIINQAAGFINQDGELIGLDGSNGIPIADAEGKTISIHHKSHLAIISSNPYDGDIYDFTSSANQAEGIEQLKLVDGKYMLYSGDYDNTGIINSNDFNLWKIQSAALNQYLNIDGDGNGIINSLDFNLWQNNKSKVGQPSIRY